MKHQFHTRDICVLVGLVVFSFWGLGVYAMPIMAVMCLMVVSGYCNTIAIYDSKTKWQEYESILPITVKKKVLARYIVCIGMLLLMLVSLFFINSFLAVYSKNTQFYILLLGFWAAYMQMMIAIPLSLKRGGDKASFILFFLLGIIVMIFWSIKFLELPIEKILYIISEPVRLSVLLVVITLIGTFASYKFSLK